MTPEDAEKYTLFLRKVQKVIDEIKPPSATMCTVLLKIILVELISRVGLRKAHEILHEGIDEAIESLEKVYEQNKLQGQ
jgi:hypothetical protein